MTSKLPSSIAAERRYADRARVFVAAKSKVTVSDSTTPWKTFFSQGEGASLVTNIPKSSVQSMCYTYNKSMGVKFKLSYEHLENGSLKVTIVGVEGR